MCKYKALVATSVLPLVIGLALLCMIPVCFPAAPAWLNNGHLAVNLWMLWDTTSSSTAWPKEYISPGCKLPTLHYGCSLDKECIALHSARALVLTSVVLLLFAGSWACCLQRIVSEHQHCIIKRRIALAIGVPLFVTIILLAGAVALFKRFAAGIECNDPSPFDNSDAGTTFAYAVVASTATAFLLLITALFRLPDDDDVALTPSYQTF